MEIYRNSNLTLEVDIPAGATVLKTVVVSTDGRTRTTDHYDAGGYVVEDGKITILVSSRQTRFDGEIKVIVTIDDEDGPYDISYYYDVVTPLFTADDLAGTNYPAEKVQELERLVRKVVEAYTEQQFGPVFARYNTEVGETTLRFDAPLIEFRGVSSRYLTHTTTLAPPKIKYELLDGGFKAIVDLDLYDPKTDSMWILNQDKHRSMTFEGIFGYDRVPQDVKQAALLIAGTWSDDQAVWRDRFIETMRSADWTVSYHENAFASTGSATADMLLKKYHRRAVPEVL